MAFYPKTKDSKKKAKKKGGKIAPEVGGMRGAMADHFRSKRFGKKK